MENQYLPYEGKSSFLKGKGKYYIGLVLFLVIGAAIAGFLLYPDEEKNTSESKFEARDLIPESWIVQNFGTTDADDPRIGGIFGDPDGDKLNNYQEYLYGTDPNNKDTDGDLYNDGTEVAYGSNPLGRGVEDLTQQVERSLRVVGADITRESIEEFILADLGEERAPYVRDINLVPLNIIEDNSNDAILAYNLKFIEIISYLQSPEVSVLVGTLFEFSQGPEIDRFIAGQSDLVQNLISMAVPSDLVELHKLQIQLNDALLGIGVAAKETLEKDKIVSTGYLHPEISYMSQLEPKFLQLKNDLSLKHGLTF